MADKLGIGRILPLEVLDKCLGRKLWVVMRDNREFYGTL
jgi:small nuclear ribonucleoprotein (snRNP)-like protein